ncbi:MAG: glycosyltransferase family 61 protein [Planctomycetota bacterium]
MAMQEGGSNQPIADIPAASIDVPDAWMFLHPTRIGSTWEPAMRHLFMPGYTLERPAAQVWKYTGESWHFFEPQSPATSLKDRFKRKYHRRNARRLRQATERLEGPLYDARSVAPGNIAHISGELIPKLMFIRRQGVEPTVILGTRTHPLIQNVLELFGAKAYCSDRTIQGTFYDASAPSNGQYEPHHQPFLRDFEPIGGWVADTPAKVFIPRRGSRELLNHDEIEQRLAKRGFETVYFEKRPLREQWSILRNAETIVATHGAALGNMIFAARRPRVVELFGPGYVVDCYRHLTVALGGRWSAAIGRITAEVVQQIDQLHRPRACQQNNFALSPETVTHALDVQESTPRSSPC